MLHDYTTMSPAELQAHGARRLNVGCGEWPLYYFTNLDADPRLRADIHAAVPPLPFEDGALDDIYAGHFLEHLGPEDATAFLLECFRCLAPGGRLGIVVPDTREIMTRWLNGAIDHVEFPADVWHPVADLDAICRMFLYSTVQDSGHKWSYDLFTLARLLQSCGFEVTGEIDRYRDPRVTNGAWYGFGLDAKKPAVAA
jgi:predicted SAM-dependent methyltransferase